MKKALSVFILTAMVLTSLAFVCMAADTVENFNNFTGELSGDYGSYLAGNFVESGYNAADYYGAQAGVYGREADDTSIKLFPAKDEAVRTNGNPHIKLNESFKAENGEYIHAGLAFAAKETTMNSFGLGGKLYYNMVKDSVVTSGSGFMNGTAIDVKNNKIYVFGNEIADFKTQTWYSIDIFINTETGRQTVYLNGKCEAFEVMGTSTLQGVECDSWYPTGFIDLRLNTVIAKGVTNDFYFDDLRYGITDTITLNEGITGAEGSGITVSCDEINLNGGVYANAEAIKNALKAPDNAVISVDYERASVSAVYDDGTCYVYSIVNNGVIPTVSYKYDYKDYSGGLPSGYQAVNVTGAENGGWSITYDGENGALGRTEGDTSLRINIPELIKNGCNPHWKILTDNKINTQTSGGIIHIGGSFAADSLNGSFGIGGPVIYTADSDESVLLGTTGNIFANGTVISFEADGKIKAWGAQAGTYEPGMFYRVDSYINTSTGCQTVYINGSKTVIDNARIGAKINGSAEWKLRGMRDVRLNYVSAFNVKENIDETTQETVYTGSNEQKIYFDDLVFETLNESDSSIGSFAAVTPKNSSVTVNGGVIDFGGIPANDETAVLAQLNIPEGAEAVYDGELGILRVVKDAEIYFYRIANNGVTTYNFNNKTSLFGGVSYVGGLGTKSAEDYSVTASAAVNAMGLEADISDGSALTVEANILTEGIPEVTACIFEPWFKNIDGGDTATNLIGFGPKGKIYVSGKEAADYEVNRWYKAAVTFTGDSNIIKIYINGEKIGEYENVSGKVLTKMFRIKCSFPSNINMYLDDISWYKGEYSAAAAQTNVSSTVYTVQNNRIMLDNADITAGELKANIQVSGNSYKIYNDYLYSSEAAESDIITKNSVLVIEAEDGTTKNYYGFMIKNPGVRNVEFIKSRTIAVDNVDVYELSATFEANEAAVENGNTVIYKIIIAEYEAGMLKGIVCRDVELSKDNLFTADYVEYKVTAGKNADLKAFIWDGKTFEPMTESTLSVQ